MANVKWPVSFSLPSEDSLELYHQLLAYRKKKEGKKIEEEISEICEVPRCLQVGQTISAGVQAS
jgi:hypothetical protein